MPPKSKDRLRLSLVAEFDDVLRLCLQLSTGNEKEFISVVENQDANRLKWYKKKKENDELKLEIQELKDECKALETQKKHLRRALETADGNMHKVEEENRSLERQIAIIKEVLLSDQNALNNPGGAREELAFLNTHMYSKGPEISPRRLDTIQESIQSGLSSLEISFDKTNDGLENSCSFSKGNKRCSDYQQTVAKKPRLYDESVNAIEDCFVDDYVTNRCCRSQRCFSEPMPLSEHLTIRQICKSDNMLIDGELQFVDEPVEQVFPRNSITPLRRLSSVGAINRNHIFCNKTIIRPETCYPCGGRISFYKPALKCQDCKVTCHPECKANVPLPCYPIMHTPTGKGTMKISDYVPTFPPLIPPSLVHCIGEIEARGMNEIGVYRVSGSEREVKELKEKLLKGKNIPCLSKIDIHAICGTVKEFLRSLTEPLITRALRAEFVSACEMPKKLDQIIFIRQSVDKLPLPNKDTLAFLIVHLNRIADSPMCKMPKSNLSKVFGPAIVGYFSSECTRPSIDILTETRHQCKIVEVLLSIQIDFWNSILGIHETKRNSPLQITTTKTSPLNTFSECASPYNCSMSQVAALGKTSLAPRGIHSTSMKAKRFFSSPLLK